MRQIFVTDDGFEFDTQEKASKHEAELKSKDKYTELISKIKGANVLKVTDYHSFRGSEPNGVNCYFISTHKDKSHLDYLVQEVIGKQYSCQKDGDVFKNYESEACHETEANLVLERVAHDIEEDVQQLRSMSTVERNLWWYQDKAGCFIYIWGDEELTNLKEYAHKKEQIEDCHDRGYACNFGCFESMILRHLAEFL